MYKRQHKGSIETVYSIGNNQAEIIHAQALKSSKLVNKEIKDAGLPEGIKLGLVKKEGKIVIPDKSTKIDESDEVLFICMTEDLKKAEDLFKVREAY